MIGFRRKFVIHKYAHQIMMETTQIQAEIARLKTLLTGNLFEDGETQQQIYDLKKQLNPEIASNPELDTDDEGCLYCGS